MFFESNAGKTVEKMSNGSSRLIIIEAFVLQTSGVSSPEQHHNLLHVSSTAQAPPIAWRGKKPPPLLIPTNNRTFLSEERTSASQGSHLYDRLERSEDDYFVYP